MIIDEKDYLAHYGILRRSGRYPWGSGGTQNIRNRDFLGYVDEMRRKGLSEVEIARGVGISTTQLRAAKTIAKSQQKQAQVLMAQRLKDKGVSNVEAAKRMGIPESSFRALLVPGVKDRADVLTTVSNMLKDQVEKKKYVDVGSGQETHIGISKDKLNAALAMLKEQGYEVHRLKIPQLGTTFDTELKVLCPHGTTQKEVWLNQSKIKSITDFSDDGGHSFGKIHEPLAINPKRVAVRYKEDGGDEADGVIFVRPGISDISLGQKRYAQVRIKVGNKHYLKGMAVYKDDLPDGVDLLFNTNKTSTGNKFDAMKKLETDPDFPFGSIVRQILADPGSPKERVTSVMNIVGVKEGSGEEGSWGTWKKTLSSQFLSKQNPALAKSQLDMTYERRKKEFDEINALTNPAIKKKFLETFSDDADSAAVHLDAARLPRQNWHVIMPLETLSPNKVYAPKYRDGERVVLIRYPHGGTFEIPELIVDNKNREARKLLGVSPSDAIGIHHKVAARLSGADFDGDAVLVIPNNQGKVKHSPALEALKNFDPQKYKIPDDSPIPKITSKRKQQEMGSVSNLITDMTIKLAPHQDIAQAVRHSMVVIDSEKHGLDYKQSAIDHGIAKLKAEYQGSARSGASTLISRATSDKYVDERKARPQSQGGPVDPVTGQRVFVPTGRMKTSKGGKVVPRQQRSTKLAETDDAHTLSSGTPIEKLYADHSNKLKALANEARLIALKTPPLQRSPSAKKIYHAEVSSLNSKLAIARMNSPRERQAQIIGNESYRQIVQANPNLSKESRAKLKYKELEKARTRVGAKKEKIVITPKEWDAIQQGAISNHNLKQILDNADLDVVRSLATPRKQVLMTPAKLARAQVMLERYTRAEVADALGVSLSTLDAATGG